MSTVTDARSGAGRSYLMIVTMSTVGYGMCLAHVGAASGCRRFVITLARPNRSIWNMIGDVTMTTVGGRIIIMIIIITALYVIPEQLNRLAEVTRLRGGTTQMDLYDGRNAERTRGAAHVLVGPPVLVCLSQLAVATTARTGSRTTAGMSS